MPTNSESVAVSVVGAVFVSSCGRTAESVPSLYWFDSGLGCSFAGRISRTLDHVDVRCAAGRFPFLVRLYVKFLRNIVARVVASSSPLSPPSP